MWFLVVICASVSCETDLIAVHYEHTEALCKELGEEVYKEQKISWMCVKDLTVQWEWNSWE
jgi:hypothetical protein